MKACKVKHGISKRPGEGLKLPVLEKFGQSLSGLRDATSKEGTGPAGRGGVSWARIEDSLSTPSRTGATRAAVPVVARKAFLRKFSLITVRFSMICSTLLLSLLPAIPERRHYQNMPSNTHPSYNRSYTGTQDETDRRRSYPVGTMHYPAM